jgi:hypothetical protein
VQRILGIQDQMLNEEYYVALNKIVSSEQGRQLFVELVSGHAGARSDSKNHHRWLGRAAFQNLKHAFDLMLYEA